MGGSFNAWTGTKEEWTRTFGHFFFFFYRFQRSKHSTWWKKGRSKIESNRGMETTGSKHTRPFVALYILSICSTLLDGAKLCPLFYFETFFILSSRAEKFSSIACRFSFIVCWTWWGEKWNMTEKKQSWSRRFPPMRQASGWRVTRSDFLCLLHWFHLFVRTLSFPSGGLRSWLLTPPKSLLLSCHSSLIGLWNQPCSRRDAGLPTCARRVLLSFRVLLIICWVVSRWVSSWPNCMATRGADRWRKDRVSIAAQNLQPRLRSDLNCWLRQQQS